MFSKAVCPVGGTSPIAVVPVVTASTGAGLAPSCARASARSEEHTSELQSPCNLVCRLLLEKKKKHVFIHLCERSFGVELGGRRDRMWRRGFQFDHLLHLAHDAPSTEVGLVYQRVSVQMLVM